LKLVFKNGYWAKIIASRAFHRKTRIETESPFGKLELKEILPEHSIEKLGLKQKEIKNLIPSKDASRAFHRKTRIETFRIFLCLFDIKQLPEHSIEKLGLKR